MKFAVRRQDLQQELGLVQGVVEARATIPMLSHLLLRAEKGKGLDLLATDLEIGLRTPCAAEVAKGGSVAVPAKKLHDIVRALGSEEISFEREANDWIRVEGGSFRGRIVGLAADDFPAQPELAKDGVTVRLSLAGFQQMVGRVLFAVTTENTRFSINGALLKLRPDGLSLVATDGHRLAHVERKLELPEIKAEVTALVPRKALAELNRLRPADENEELEVAIGGNHVFFRAGQRTLFSRTLEGSFPNYERVIPSENPHVGRFDRLPFADVLARVELLTSEASKLVTFSLGREGLTVSTSNPSTGEATETLPGEWSGDEVRIGLNCEYVLQFLQAVSAEKVEVRLRDGATQALLVPVEEGVQTAYQYVVMPMRLS